MSTLLTGGTHPDVADLLTVIGNVGGDHLTETARREGFGVGILDYRDERCGCTSEEVSTWSIVIGEDHYTLIQLVAGVLGEDGEAWAYQALTTRPVPDLDTAAAIASLAPPRDDPHLHRIGL